MSLEHPALKVAVAALVLIAVCLMRPAFAEQPVTDNNAANAEDEVYENEVYENEVYKNTVKWATASEVDNFGYDVYRSQSEEGPFERLNPEVIEGAGTTDEPTRYRYVDDTIDPHTTYYYYVESISMSGVRERFTPIAKVPPKIPAEEETVEQDGPSE